MIEMFINGGEIKEPDRTLPVLDNQQTWSRVMLILAILTPPWMLFVKPFILYKSHQQE
jgi:hypothetical protein